MLNINMLSVVVLENVLSSCQRLHSQKDFCNTIMDVLIVHLYQFSGLTRHRFYYATNQLLAGFIHADIWSLWISAAFVHYNHIFHGCYDYPDLFQGYFLAFHYVKLKFV